MSETKPVALRAIRESAIARLSDAFARDEIEIEVFEERLELAHRALTVAEIEALTNDLAPIVANTALVPTPTALPANVTQQGSCLAIFGGVERRGHWTPPRHLRVVAMFGGVELDFREALLAPGVTEIEITAVMGGVNITVPPTLSVEMNGTAIMGGFQHSHRASVAPDPTQPLLRITGFAMMGGVNIETMNHGLLSE